jgi:RNA 2',3'-cyclic 3'-phosphodiesterase
VTKERLKSPRARLFFALDLPGAVLEGIDAWGREELRDPALRRIPPQSLHITLAFLGYMPQKAIPRLAEIGEASRAPSPRIALSDPVQRPERGRARLFALPAESAGTVAVQAGLQERLVAAGLYEPEKRPFWPHVTVARVRREERSSKRPAPVSRPPGTLPKALLRPFGAVRITLYRSELQPRGAQYVPLAQVELPAGGRQ